MQEILPSILRDKTTSTAAFRTASDHLARLLCGETISKLTAGLVDIQTPVGATNGISMPTDIMAVPILRAALALLPAFTRVMPEIPVGLIGVERDEETASPIAYYKISQAIAGPGGHPGPHAGDRRQCLSGRRIIADGRI